jgi:hypothetical protein
MERYMSNARAKHEVEVAVSPEGVLVAYSDEALDEASGLRLVGATGALFAIVRGRPIDCGYVTEATGARLATVAEVIWARFADGRRETIKVTGIKLEHA